MRRSAALALAGIMALLSISEQGALTRGAPLPIPDPPATRDKYQQPFASTSIWNMPIGSNAFYLPANIQQATGWGMTVDPDIIILEPDAPLTPVHFSPDGWSGASRCTPQQLLYSVPVPADFVVPGATPASTPNHAAAILMPDGRTIKQPQPFTRCTAGEPATALATYPDVDIYGDGIPGAHGGSGLSSIGGTIRLGELVPGGVVRHALKINLDDTELWGGAAPRFRWPAVKADEPNFYTGDVAALKMGALLALPPSFDVNTAGFETGPGEMLAWTLQNYGGYVVDTTGFNVYALAVEHSPDGTVEAEFEAAWGFSMTPQSRNNAWSRDMDRIFGALHVISNNTATAIGGGGIPRQPLAPPITGDPDSDGDGAGDTVDNCPAAANPDQTNSDTGPAPPHGHLGVWGNGPDISNTKHTIPNGDTLGDACDPDRDNDDLLDIFDLNPIGATGPCAAWAGASDGHSQPAYGDVTDHDGNGPSWDTDGDQVLDGVECALGTNPRSGSAAHRIACASSVPEGGLADSDADGLLDVWEVCKWGTDPHHPDTDRDGLRDCVEALDVNGNHIVTHADSVFLLRASFRMMGGDWIFDVNGNGLLSAADAMLIKQAVFGLIPCI